MRIISGKARGTKLYTLEGNNTRPTLDRIKESLFNIIQQDLPDCIFLDLFSGSGAIGLEAASRGARKVILGENSKQAIKIIEKNIEKTHLKEQVELLPYDYKIILENYIKEPLDIIYIDPPYRTDYAYKAIKAILDNKLLNEQGIIIIETDNKEKVLDLLEKIEIQIKDIREYGRVKLIFLSKKDT